MDTRIIHEKGGILPANHLHLTIVALEDDNLMNTFKVAYDKIELQTWTKSVYLQLKFEQEVKVQ